MSFFDLFNPVRRLFGATPTARADDQRQRSAASRGALYSLNDALYDNAAYSSHWDAIRLNCFPKADPGVRPSGFFSPFKEIVESYQNLMPGTFGNGISIAQEFEGRPINPKLEPNIRTLWRDSNLDTEKGMIIRRCANLGTVGLRVSFIPSANKVIIQHDHPSRIHYVEQDSQGNVVAVVLKYKLPRNVGTRLDPQFEDVEVIEEITKEGFSVKFGETEQLTDAERQNPHGFCPYVILRHKENGNIFGDWSYKGSEFPVHQINYRISQQDRSIGRHMFPKWVFGAASEKPAEIEMSEGSASFLKLHPDSPTPFVQALVPQVNQAAAQEFWMQCRDMLRGRQPELTINDVKLLGGISGETIRQVLKPAESAILGVRPSYDHAFVRIIQMALSIGADMRLWDVGTGNGANAGDRAYKSGQENFAFADRPALPPTPDQVIIAANASQADRTAKLGAAKLAQGLGVSSSETLRLAGYSAKEIADIQAERSREDIVPTVEQ